VLPPRATDGTFTKPTHPRQLFDLATDLGIPSEDIREMPTEALQAVVNSVARQAQRLEREAQARQQTLLSSIDRNITTQAPAPAPEPEPLSGLDMSQYDPGIAEALSLVRQQAKELKALKAEMQQLKGNEVRRENERLSDIADRHFADYKTFLGEGRGHELASDSAELTRRRAILAMAEMDQSRTSFENKLKKALVTMYGEAGKTPAPTPPPATPAPTTPTQEAWLKGGVAKPTHREAAPEPPGVRKAEKSVAAILAEAGRNGAEQSGSATEEDFL